jgi:Ca2+-binding EF-hand superfamily protein
LTALPAILLIVSAAPAQTPEKKPLKKPPIGELLKQSPDDFIKQFDKNKDGFLDKAERPPFLAGVFERVDADGDGRLNRAEVTALLQAARQMALKGPFPPKGDVETIINGLLKQQDADMDGQISRQEAKNRLGDGFAKLDQNRDGFLDRKELRVAAQLMQDALGGPGFTDPNDFHAMDRNADGRLAREELKGTPWLARFADIDANNDGRLDRLEFEGYLRRNAEKK